MRTIAIVLGACAAVVQSGLCGEALSQEKLQALAGSVPVAAQSGLVTVQTAGAGVPLEADVRASKYLTLLVSDAGDSYACDHSDWVEACISGTFGEKKLSELPWLFAHAGWGDVRKNRSANNQPLRINGKTYNDGIGMHSPGIVVFELPAGTEHFRAFAGLDEGGTKQGNTAPSSVQFIVLAGLPSPELLKALRMPSLPDFEQQKRMQKMVERYGDSFAVREFVTLQRELTQPLRAHKGIADEATRAAQAVHPQATIWKTDRDPLDVKARRLQALYEDLKSKVDLSASADAVAAVQKQASELPITDAQQRLDGFIRAEALCRTIAFKNPLVQSIEKLLFITREALPPDEFNSGNHMCDQYFGFHATLHGKTKGNGLYVLDKPWSDKPEMRNLIADSVIESGTRRGQKLGNGGYLSPDLSYDGKEILFCYTDGEPQIRVWNDKTTFHVFKCQSDGSKLEQITDGSVNDLFPCWLPNGRVAFISERRGGFGRCHGRPVPSFTLHTMFPDGTDIVQLSPHETNEWHPSVDNNGMIIYTRWDYVDRGFNQAHHVWITYPDGRDSRSVNGNTHASERTAPHMEMQPRAIPGSSKYVAVASGHHTESRGSLVLIDPTIPDDDAMAQIKRLTPDQLFPEAEFYHDRGSGAYSTPWPLSEQYYLCVYDGQANAQYGPIATEKRRYSIVLLDVFGNRVEVFTHPEISCLNPMPLRPRQRPPILAHGTLVGRPALADGTRPVPIPKEQLPKTAKIGLINVYNTRRPFPQGTKIKALRIWQVLPKTTPLADVPRIGYGDQKGAKIVLGTVPVEADGSAYWEQPVNVPILFHALDENGAAVQGMRSVTYVAPGETLMCNGCHDQRVGSQPPVGTPVAMKRPASIITPETVDGTNPFHFARLIQPILDAKCVACHTEHRKAGGKNIPPDLSRGNYTQDKNRFYASFVSLKPYVKFYNSASFTESYTVPGNFGAYGSKLYQMLKKGHHDVQLAPDEWRRLAIWMDSNGLFHGHDVDIDAQAEGKVVPIPMY